MSKAQLGATLCLNNRIHEFDSIFAEMLLIEV